MKKYVYTYSKEEFTASDLYDIVMAVRVHPYQDYNYYSAVLCWYPAFTVDLLHYAEELGYIFGFGGHYSKYGGGAKIWRLMDYSPLVPMNLPPYPYEELEGKIEYYIVSLKSHPSAVMRYFYFLDRVKVVEKFSKQKENHAGLCSVRIGRCLIDANRNYIDPLKDMDPKRSYFFGRFSGEVRRRFLNGGW